MPHTSTTLQYKRALVNGVTLHYVTAGQGPVVLCMHGWPQNHRQFLPLISALGQHYRFIAPDLRGYADSDKPSHGYAPRTIATDMLELLAIENAGRFHILSHDLGGPPALALAYMAGARALSLAAIETPFFGLAFPGYVDPRAAYWHLGMQQHAGITRCLIEGREEQYLRHYFRDFACHPAALPEAALRADVAQMLRPGHLRASLNHYDAIPAMASQTAELTRSRLGVPMLAWGGRVAFGAHCYDSACAIATSVQGGVIDECGHWVFEEKADFIRAELARFWARHDAAPVPAPDLDLQAA